MNISTAYYDSPVGTLKITGGDNGIHTLEFVKSQNPVPQLPLNEHVEQCLQQLDSYFAGKLTQFDLKLNLEGTDFYIQVWEALMQIEYGKTASYRDIAQQVGNPRAYRPVGNANNKNRIPVIIPCHRVTGLNGRLGGYQSGLDIKKWLLDFEYQNAACLKV